MSEKEMLEVTCPHCGCHKEVKTVNEGLDHFYFVCECMMCKQSFTLTVEKPKAPLRR
jgi:hypothetical protein